jgi:hypothetical protein
MTDYKEQRQTATPKPDDVQDPRLNADKVGTVNGKPAYFWRRKLSEDEVRWLYRND